MPITVPEIKQILIDKEIEYLYHANSVATSVTFLEQGGLLSRGAVEERGLFQTEQQTDELDQQLNIYYDLFFDSVDIHVWANDLNSYGPITFVYSIDILDTLHDNIVKITRDNPIRWSTLMTEEERYFTDLNQMRLEYQKGIFKQHLTICNMHQPLPFEPYLDRILIENPNIQNTSYFNNAFNRIQSILQNKGIRAPLEVRNCPADCNCQRKYHNYQEGFIYHRFKIE